MKVAKRKIKTLLILSTIILWGIIIYNITIYINSNNEESSMYDQVNRDLSDKMISNSEKQISIDTIKYLELNKSPFELGKNIEKKTKNKISIEISKPVVAIRPKINYQISGVIINKENKLVIFEDITNNKTLFLSEGEEYQSIHIKVIDVEKVVIEENGYRKFIEIIR